MRQLTHIYRSLNRTLRIWESKNKLRGEVFDNNTNQRISFADFYRADGDADEYRVREYYGFKSNCYEVPFERRNGKIVLFPMINIHRRIIWTNDDYNEWEKAMLADGEEKENITYERYYDDCDINLDDERANLDVEVDGYIVVFGNIGTWRGNVQGAAVIGTNVRDILHSECDYCTWYCDLHNVRFEGAHHDGNNYYLYRVAQSKDAAERLAYKIADGEITEEQFRKATKSLRPYVAKVYGF
jgi:hypothetical protein